MIPADQWWMYTVSTHCQRYSNTFHNTLTTWGLKFSSVKCVNPVYNLALWAAWVAFVCAIFPRTDPAAPAFCPDPSSCVCCDNCTCLSLASFSTLCHISCREVEHMCMCRTLLRLIYPAWSSGSRREELPAVGNKVKLFQSHHVSSGWP